MMGIHAAGAYAPGSRLDTDEIAKAWDGFDPTGIETTAVPAADEDTLTLGWEAAKRAIDAAGIQSSTIDHLAFATTTPPIEATDLVVRLGSMLDVESDVPHRQLTGSTRVGTSAIRTVMEAEPTCGLVVCSDIPSGTPASFFGQAGGAGAAAFVLGPAAPAHITDWGEAVATYPGLRHRPPGGVEIQAVNTPPYERSAMRETTADAVATLSERLDQEAVAVQAPDWKAAATIADAIPVDTDLIEPYATVDMLGDTGAASVPLSLARALADKASPVLCVSFGSGAGSHAFTVEVDDPVPAVIDLEPSKHLSYAVSLRYRGAITDEGPPSAGASVSLPDWQRSLPQRHRLEAGRCPECEAIAFPPEGACPECRAVVEFEPVLLPRRGVIQTVTEITGGGEPPEFAEHRAAMGTYHVAMVRFEVGDRSVDQQFQLTAGVTDPDPGDPVVPVIRRLYEDEGVPRYAYKMAVDAG